MKKPLPKAGKKAAARKKPPPKWPAIEPDSDEEVVVSVYMYVFCLFVYLIVCQGNQETYKACYV